METPEAEAPPPLTPPYFHWREPNGTWSADGVEPESPPVPESPPDEPEPADDPPDDPESDAGAGAAAGVVGVSVAE